MLNPLEITQKVFKSGMSGYNKKEVDDFLEEVKHDYEELYQNVVTLKDEKSRIRKELDQYVSTGEQLQKALTLAQKTADDIKQSAGRQADLTIMQANVKSQQIVQKAEEKLAQINNVYRRFSSELSSYLQTYQNLLQKLDSEAQKTVQIDWNQLEEDE
ncbi:MAG: DivIVA domain-containing protein [Caldisericia bacterium]|nr:DivIVA domain-containing protein [Caldisericia bacterium]